MPRIRHLGVLAALVYDIVANLLAFVETLKSRAFDRADVDERVLAAIVGLDESKAFLGVEPLHGA